MGWQNFIGNVDGDDDGDDYGSGPPKSHNYVNDVYNYMEILLSCGMDWENGSSSINLKRHVSRA